jgi:uncharacterized protein YjiK
MSPIGFWKPINLVVQAVTNTVINFFAGNVSIPVSGDGTGTAARFNNPFDITKDTLGNFYILDSDDNNIRKMTSAGVVTSFAGTTGVSGSTDGTGTAAEFNYPIGIASDASNNLYVADYGNNVVRKVTSAGVVSTFAGTAGQYYIDPSFNQPHSVTRDSAGNLYIADSGNNTIRKFSSTGILTTLAGTPGVTGSANGTGANASFNKPSGITVDTSGNVFVADSLNHTIRKITSAGVVTTFAGTIGQATGPGLTPGLNSPTSVVKDSSGNYFVVENASCIIRKVTSTGSLSVFAGAINVCGTVNGTGASANFNYPTNIAIDSTNNLFVSDNSGHAIRKITPAGVVTTLAGTAGVPYISASFAGPMATAIDSTGNIFVADSENHTIRKISTTGIVTTFAGTNGLTGNANGVGTAASFNYPKALAIDGSNNIYVADSGNYSIRKITPAGTVTTFAGDSLSNETLNGTGVSAHFMITQSLALDASGNLYVGEVDPVGGGNIRKNTPAGVVTTLAVIDGSPTGVIKNNTTGDLFVVDSYYHCIRKVTSAGVVTDYAGTCDLNNSLTVDGNGTSASFENPYGIGIDSSQNLFVSDLNNNSIRKISSIGDVTTFAGGNVGFLDGTGIAAAFQNPLGLTVTSAGIIYVSDYGNNSIRKITSAGVVTTYAGSSAAFGSTDGRTSADGTGTNALFNFPTGLKVDSSGNVYVADTESNSIRKITSAGVVTTIAGGVNGYLEGNGLTAQFSMPLDLALDSSGNIFVADYANHVIRKITPTADVTTFAGSGSPGVYDDNGVFAEFNLPAGITIDSSNNLYVTDAVNVIRKITPAADVTTIAGTANTPGTADGAGTSATFSVPMGIFSDAAGNLVITDSISCLIRKINTLYDVTTFAGTAGNCVTTSGGLDGSGTDSTFNNPTALAIDSSNNIYVADTDNHLIRKITSTGVVTTIAGTVGVSGSTNATGTSAKFNFPGGVCVTSTGVLYVADTENHIIRKITTAGVVTTVSGSAGTPGLSDDTGLLSLFNTPTGIGINGNGKFYVADVGNNRIRVVDPASGGDTSTFAGQGFAATVDGTGTVANFNHPTSLVVDSSGNLYIAEEGGNVIRKSTSAKVVTTITGTPDVIGSDDGSLNQGNGTGAAARFQELEDITVDSSGNVYVVDRNTVRKITSAGVVTRLAGSVTINDHLDGTGLAAHFYSPTTIQVDSTGNLFVTDTHRVRKITSAGVVTTLVGNGNCTNVNGTGTAASLCYITGASIDSANNLYISGAYDYTIRKVTSAGVVTTYSGINAQKGYIDGNAATAKFYKPGNSVMDSSSNLFVLDRATIRKVTTSGDVSTFAGVQTSGLLDGTGAAARFSGINSLAMDSSGNMFVADSQTIRKITSAGEVSTFMGYDDNGSLHGSGDTWMIANWKSSLAFDSNGLLIYHIGNGIKYTSNSLAQASYSLAEGTTGIYFSQMTINSSDIMFLVNAWNGDIYKYDFITASKIATVAGANEIAANNSGSVYVSSPSHHVIYKMNSSGGGLSIFAGTLDVAGSDDGTGVAAKFNNPRGMATDSSGNVYIADSGNNTIRKITSAGVVTTIVGTPGVAGEDLSYMPGKIYSPTVIMVSGSKLYFNSGYGIVWINKP